MRIPPAGTVPAVEQHRGPAVAGGKLQAPCRGLVGHFDFGDHAGQRSVAQAVLGHGQDLAVLCPLRIEHFIRAEPDLFERRRIEIEARQRPEHGHPGPCCKARGDAGGEQRGCGIVAPGRAGTRDFVEGAAAQASVGEGAVDLGHPERQGRAARGLRCGDLRAQRGERVGRQAG